MVSASQPGSGTTTDVLPNTDALPSFHAAQDNPDKSLAVLLTHISNSHAMLVEKIDFCASGSTFTDALTQSQVSTSSHNVDYKQQEPMLATDAQQGVGNIHEDMSTTLTDATEPVQLHPYQQELADCVMQTDNSVLFLPSGMGNASACMH